MADASDNMSIIAAIHKIYKTNIEKNPMQYFTVKSQFIQIKSFTRFRQQGRVSMIIILLCVHCCTADEVEPKQKRHKPRPDLPTG